MGGKALKPASAADWSRNRELITQLYQENELGEVMETMKTQYGFYSTPKIYKNHIKEWNIGKRLCDADILTILDLRARPGAGGKKQTEFWIRGHRVSEKNITRYLRRKPELLARFQEGDRPSPKAKNQVVCKPKISPPPRSAAPPPTVAAPLTVLELFFLDCRDYIRGSFDNGHWESDVAGDCFSLVDGDRASKACDDADLDFTLASQEMDDQNFGRASQLLQSCWSRLSDTLALEDPYFLEAFISMVVRLLQWNQLELIATLATIMMDCALISHGDSHKLTSIISRLQLLADLETADRIAQVFEVVEDEADRALGLGSKFASAILLTHTQVISSMGTGEAAARIRKQLDVAEKVHGGDEWVVNLELHHSWAECLSMYEQGRLDEAEDALIAAKPRIVSDLHRASHHSAAGDFYSWQNNWDAARAEYEEAFFAAERQGNAGVVQRCLKDLIHVSEKTGNMAAVGTYRLFAAQKSAGATSDEDWEVGMGVVLGDMEMEMNPDPVWGGGK